MTRLRTLSLLALLALTSWVYWGSLAHPFHFDDALFLQSAQVTEAANVWDILNPAQGRQITYLTFFLNYRLGGTDPSGYHLVNLLLHLANVTAVFFLSGILAKKPENGGKEFNRWLPLAAAGVFALHPIQSEAVNYIYQRSALLAGFLSIGALCAFLKAEESPNPGPLYAAAGALSVLAGSSKESALALPVIFFAYLWVHAPDRKSLKERLHRARWLFASLGALMIGGGIWILHLLLRSGEKTTGFGVERVSSLQYLLGQIPVVVRYLRLVLWPAGLSVEHDPPGASLTSPYTWLCLLTSIGLLALLLHVRRSNACVSFLGLGFLIFLAPTSSIIPSADRMFEHRLYLPMIMGSQLLAIAIFSASGKLVPKFRGIARAAVCGTLLAGCAALSRERTYVWGDAIRLWEEAVASAPRKARAHYNLGVACLGANRHKAREEFLKTVQLRPDHAPALYNLGWLEQSGGNMDSAVKYYRAAIEADPRHWQAHHNLANSYVLQGRFEDAAGEFQRTIRLNQNYSPAYLALATLQFQQKQAGAARATLQRLLQVRPGLLEARYLMARAFLEEGKLEEAASELRLLYSQDRTGAYKERIEELRRYAVPVSK